MKLIGEINQEKHELDIRREDGRVFARVDDREYDLETSEVEPNVYLFKHENQVFEIYVAPNGIVNVGDHQLEVGIVDPKRLRAGNSERGSAEGVAEIKTAMPGKIVRIVAEVGAEIKHGEPVVVVEAMKMQNELKSPKDGVVKEIRFEEGATVHAGDVLAVIE